MKPLLVRPVENQLREAELDRDSSRFFLGQAIGINSGERFDKGALAVIDVTGGCENEMFRHLKLVEARPSVAPLPENVLTGARRANRVDHGVILLRENCAQIEFETRIRDIADDRWI